MKNKSSCRVVRSASTTTHHAMTVDQNRTADRNGKAAAKPSKLPVVGIASCRRAGSSRSAGRSVGRLVGCELVCCFGLSWLSAMPASARDVARVGSVEVESWDASSIFGSRGNSARKPGNSGWPHLQSIAGAGAAVVQWSLIALQVGRNTDRCCGCWLPGFTSFSRISHTPPTPLPPPPLFFTPPFVTANWHAGWSTACLPGAPVATAPKASPTPGTRFPQIAVKRLGGAILVHYLSIRYAPQCPTF